MFEDEDNLQYFQLRTNHTDSVKREPYSSNQNFRNHNILKDDNGHNFHVLMIE